MTLAAVLCCTISNIVLTSCEAEKSYPTMYRYEVEQKKELSDLLGSRYYTSSDSRSVQDAFNAAIGSTNGNYSQNRNMDAEMKSACDQVQSRYVNSIESTYMKFILWRITTSADPDSQDTKEAIGEYVVGKAVNTPYVDYSVETTGNEARAALDAMKSELGDSLYKVCRKSLSYLLGYTSTSSSTGSSSTGSSTVSSISISTSVYENVLQKEYITVKPWEDTEAHDRTVREWCDYITQNLDPLTLAVGGTVNVVKTGVINKQKTVLWTKTFEPNLE